MHRRPFAHASRKLGFSASHQAVVDSTAGRDIVLIQHFYNSGPIKGEMAMNNTSDGQSTPLKSQTVEDSAAKNIKLTSELEDNTMTVRRSPVRENIELVQRKPAVMKFLGGSAGGWGVAGLVIALLAWIAYKYWSGR